MKSLFVLSALLSATSALAAPKVGSTAKYKVTYSSGAGAEAQTQLAEMQAVVKKIDPETNVILIQMTVTVNEKSETVESEENLKFFTETLTLPKNCTLARAKEVMALDPTADRVLTAEPVEVDTIFGKISACKLTQIDQSLTTSQAWISDKSLGFDKLIISGEPRTEIDLIEYRE